MRKLCTRASTTPSPRRPAAQAAHRSRKNSPTTSPPRTLTACKAATALTVTPSKLPLANTPRVKCTPTVDVTEAGTRIDLNTGPGTASPSTSGNTTRAPQVPSNPQHSDSATRDHGPSWNGNKSWPETTNKHPSNSTQNSSAAAPPSCCITTTTVRRGGGLTSCSVSVSLSVSMAASS